MSLFEALFLGIIQGLTEFLPVSSSGHLVLFQQLLGFEEPLLLFDVAVHFGTLLAIGLFFWKDIVHLKKSEALAVVVGTIPAGLVGVFLEEYVTMLFGSIWLVGVALLVTGGINLLTDRILGKRDREPQTDLQTTFSIKDSLIVGVLQAMAIIPGISRSGSTVMGGILTGHDRQSAFRFAFLLAIPAIGGATFLHLLDADFQIAPELLLPYSVGLVTAGVTGFLSLKLLKYMTTQAKFEWFGWYCIGVGMLTLTLQLL